MTDHNTDHTTETSPERDDKMMLAETMLATVFIQMQTKEALEACADMGAEDLKSSAEALWLIGVNDACACLAEAASHGMSAGVERFKDTRADLAERIDMLMQLEEQ